jgi:Domain of unknown function (DUF6285)
MEGGGMTDRPRDGKADGAPGGEPGGARLLALARRELLDTLLPQLQGAARYRARLIANAMKIAGRELEGEGPEGGEIAHRLRGLAAAELPGAAEISALDDREVAAALCAALRAGRLDGRQDLHDLLERLARARGRLLE